MYPCSQVRKSISSKTPLLFNDKYPKSEYQVSAIMLFKYWLQTVVLSLWVNKTNGSSHEEKVYT